MMKKAALLLGAFALMGCGEKSPSETSDSASEKLVASDENSKPSSKGELKSEAREESKIESEAKPEAKGLPPLAD